MQNITISALADTDEHAIRDAMKLAPHAAAFESGTNLLDRGDLSAVVIALPSSLHAQTAIDAFDRGLNVYLEKPVALTMEDALRVSDAWRRSKKIGAIGHNYRFNPLYLRLKQQIAAGAIGRVQQVLTEFHVPSPAPGSWRSSALEGGVLLDLGTHHFDFIRFLLSAEVESVTAREVNPTRVDVELQMSCGARAKTECSYGRRFADVVTVRGEDGTLRVDRGRSWDVARADSRRPSLFGLGYLARKLSAPFHEPSFGDALAAFVAAVGSVGSFSPDIDDGVRALAIADAARLAAESRTEVPVARGS